jgi:hypothetical protein
MIFLIITFTVASVKESMGSLVQKVFTESTKLDANGIVDFFKALCQVI